MSDDPTFQYDRKMELEKSAHLKASHYDKHSAEEYIKYYNAVIPSDKPLQDELHVKFLQRYRQEKEKDMVNPKKRFGAPMATEEHGII